MKTTCKNYERMNKKQKTKIDKTMKRMKKRRNIDSNNLRKNIKEKLEWAKEQKKKGLEAIEDFKNRININTREVWKLEGIILALTQILEEEPVDKEEKK